MPAIQNGSEFLIDFPHNAFALRDYFVKLWISHKCIESWEGSSDEPHI